MQRFEDELKQFFARRTPPADFTSRVVARVRVETSGKTSPLWRWTAIGAVAASLTIGIYVSKQRKDERVRERAEIAEAEILHSLQIAGAKIHKARLAVVSPGERGFE